MVTQTVITNGRSASPGSAAALGLARPGKAASGGTAGQGIPEFMPGDVILCPGKQIVPHILTRWVTQSHDERPTFAVHTAQFLGPRRIIEMDMVVKKRTTREFFEIRSAFEVWRCTSLTPSQRRAVSRKSLEYLGRKFGWSKLFTHLLDGAVNKVVHRQIFFFRRLNHDQRYPICSWVTAFSYDRALHYHFGVPPECADPDQIYDWISSHPGEWIPVFRLEDHPQRRSANAA
jgi:hypothetical protein